MRRPIVAANWKMHKTTGEARELATAVVNQLGAATEVETVLCPPATSLAVVVDAVRGSDVGVGAQNVHWEAQGAYTGELSAAMLADAGCDYVIVGHSERRTLFGEADGEVNRKALAVLDAGLRPIVCVGESLEQREQGVTEQVLRTQLERGLAGLGDRLREVVVAYEPVWAIGTGRTATPEQAQSAQAFIRGRLAELAGRDVAELIRIQYGGSIKPANAAELFGLPDVDGGLVGGASLEAASFVDIVRGAA